VDPGSANASSTDGSDDGIGAGAVIGIILALLLVTGAIGGAVYYRRMWIKGTGDVGVVSWAEPVSQSQPSSSRSSLNPMFEDEPAMADAVELPPPLADLLTETGDDELNADFHGFEL